jgi:hypothetical protein
MPRSVRCNHAFAAPDPLVGRWSVPVVGSVLAIALLLAAACIVPAAAKLLGHPKMRASAARFGIAWSRYRLIGIATPSKRHGD